MSEKLKTQSVSFKNLFGLDEQEPVVTPEQMHENLTTRQINATQKINLPQQELPNVQVKENVPKQSLIKDTNVKKINPYYSYMPKFYKTEIGYARTAFAISLTIFLIVLCGCCALIGLTLGVWNSHDPGKKYVNPWILLLLIIPIGLASILLVITTNRYRSFLIEARSINFRDEKVLSINVQKLYRRLKTGWIDITWFSCLAYVLLLLGMLVDSIVVIYYKNPHIGFAEFSVPRSEGNYTYSAVFWSFVGLIIFVFINHVLSCSMAYLRASNIDNFYNYSIVDPTEIQMIKKRKNRRDLIIFFAVTGTVVFLTWLIVKIVLNKKKQKEQTASSGPTINLT